MNPELINNEELVVDLNNNTELDADISISSNINIELENNNEINFFILSTAFLIPAHRSIDNTHIRSRGSGRGFRLPDAGQREAPCTL